MDESRADVLVTVPTQEDSSTAKAGDSGQAITPALAPVMPRREYFDWRTFDPAIHIDEETPMAEELATYGQHLGELLAHEGQYVLIKGREIVGIFPTRRAGLDEAVDRFGDEPAMVKQIAALEPIEVLENALP